MLSHILQWIERFSFAEEVFLLSRDEESGEFEGFAVDKEWKDEIKMKLVLKVSCPGSFEDEFSFGGFLFLSMSLLFDHLNYLRSQKMVQFLH